MAVETRKKKNSKSGSSSNPQSRKTQSKVGDSREKKDDRGQKRAYPTESQNDQKQLPKEKTQRPIFVKSAVGNLVINTMHRNLGLADASTISKFHKEVIINQMKRFHLSEILCPFDRRVTAISWHPKFPKIFVAGSKGGDLSLHNLNGGDDYFSPGVGAGGSILGLKCSDADPYTVYTASLTGKICLGNFQQRKSEVLFSLPFSLDNWFTSLDRCENRKFLLAGDSRGYAYLLSDSGKPIWEKKKLHQSKITHCEFNVHDPNIFVTSSLDHSVKLWDLRTISNSEARNLQPLAEFPHEKAVNSAYFSPSNGLSILTTDQYSELRIYSRRLWDEVITITHPHRQFQHMTQMKAIWHPLEDIVIVGRYPDDNIQKKDFRTIDFYDGSNGQLLHQIFSPTNNIVSLNALNSTGEVLAAAAGFSIAFLKDEIILRENKTEPDEDTKNKDSNSNKKKKDAVKVAKKVCPKKTVSKENILMT